MPKVVWILRNFVWNEKRPPHGSPLLKIMSKKQFFKYTFVCNESQENGRAEIGQII